MSNPPPAGGQPPSFKTNVNRAKTKRWVEAKSYSYDGDDWGDMDEYDEYGGYDEPPPPPKPTGLRQRGQSASQDQPGTYPPQQGGYNTSEANQHGYGNIGRQGPAQQQYGARNATDPPYQNQLARSGSFHQGDERRAFSNTYPHHGGPPPQSDIYHPSGPPVPQTAQNQPGPPVPQAAANIHDLNLPHGQVYHPPVVSRAAPISAHPRQPSMGSRTQSMTSNSSIDFHNRRDFSPSAVPPPLHTRGSPSPHHKTESQSAMRPPRKSSLSQRNQPQQSYGDQDAGVSEELDPEEGEPVSRGRTDSNTGRPLPFVRPADIYKRMQEEKERERQSQESSRPSMDAIMGNSGMDPEPKREAVGATDRSQDVESRQRSRSTIVPVAERRSEYGTSSAPTAETSSRGEAAEQQMSSNEPLKAIEPSRTKDSLSPQLPDVARMSGFGELFAVTSQPLKDSSATAETNQSGPSQLPPHQPAEVQPDVTLQHQPSLGFRSVVHQAFDTNEPIPETPSSNADSSIGRSGSGGTSVVSPIISRDPSSATPNLNFKDLQIRPATPPAVYKNADNEARPESSGSLDTPTAIPGTTSPDPTNQRPASFMPGHRRDLSTPSPDNSPARTPAVEANKKTQQPQEAEIAMTTPIETRFPYDHSQSESSQSSRTSPVKTFDNSDFATTHPSRIGRVKTESVILPQVVSGEPPKSPADSNRSRVRNLADKFESGRSSPAGSERAPSPVKTTFLPSQATNQSRPSAVDRLESFRPKLPGGWESSASLAPLAAPSKSEPTSAPVSLQQRLQNTRPDASEAMTAVSNSRDAPSRGSDRDGPATVAARDEVPTIDPFASLAAAGSALAGAFSTAMGSDKDDKDKQPPTRSTGESGQQYDEMAAKEESRMTRPRNTSVNTAFIPEASKPMMLPTPDDEPFSIMPTPLDKLSQPAHSGESKAGDYFATGLAPTQQASGDSHTTQSTASTRRSQLLPSISTESGPQYESDRLRREIIRELSPKVSSEPSTAADSDHQFRYSSRQTTDPSATRADSMVIPREYDSYWNDSGSGQSSRASSVKGPSKAVKDVALQYHHGQSTMSPVPATASQLPTVGGEAQPLQNQPADRPEMPAHRFSWEGSHEVVPPIRAPLPSALPSTGDSRVVDGPLPESQEQMSTGTTALVDQQIQHASTLEPGPVDSGAPSENMLRDHPLEPQATNYSAEHEKAVIPGEVDPDSPMRHSLHGNAPDSAVRDFGPSDTEADPYPPQSLHDEQENNQNPLQPMSTVNDLAPLPTPPTALPKIQSFREILAMKEPSHRIQAYNESREQFANTNTGLDHWLAVTAMDLPEHNEILPNGRLLGPADYKPSTARSKLGALLPGSSSAQQPYYQQYLNATSPASGSNAAQVPSGVSPQGFSPSSGSGKLSSQQVQARGKDLLHTAGVFGGKANVAAKGLFSKGKSKFRGGNADKAPVSSFNTKHKQGIQQQQQPSQSSPSTPQSESSTEQSYSPERSISRRPKSMIVPPEQEMQATSLEGKRDHPLQSPLAGGKPWDSNAYPASLSRQPAQIDPIGRSPPLDEAASQDLAQAVASFGHNNRLNSSENPNVIHDPIDQGRERYDQPKGIQSPHTPSSSDRTPTQADYADYVRRGPSPTAKIRVEKQSSNDQYTPREESITQPPSSQLQRNDPVSPPTLKPRHSAQTSREAPSDGGSHLSPDQDRSWVDQSVLQRGSEDSDGTFRTAESGRRESTGAGVARPHPNTPGAPHSQSSERAPNVDHLPSSVSPVPAPTENIRDQPRTRPFSFVQFSQSPAIKPFGEYPRREPSIDSTASKFDPNEDVPPSPMSSGQSMTHTHIDQPNRQDSTHGTGGHALIATDEQASSGPVSQSYPQKHQQSSLQGHPALRREHSHNKGDEALPQLHPAPMSRQDPIIPYKEATEYSVEGVGPPPIPRLMDSTSTSKRGSRSSAFFRSFKTTPNDSSSPQQPSENDGQDGDNSQETNKIRKTKSKRGSLFRSLTGAKANSGEETPAEPVSVLQPAIVQDDPKPATEAVEKNGAPAKGPGKYRNRLSRTATTKLEEQQGPEPSKKNRLSAIGSLFGRSKDHRDSSAGIDHPRPSSQQVQPQEAGRLQDRNSHVSSNKVGRGDALPSQPEEHYDYTRDKLARQGLLTEGSARRSSKPSERSAHSQDSMQRQQLFPPRHQSLGNGAQWNEQRPSNWSREHSANSINARPQNPTASRPQQSTAPVQHPRVQSSVTTRSTTRHPGLPQSSSNPRQISSTTTTITTSSRTPNPTSRQQQKPPQGNSFSRSESPPPPPPPPKDTWHQSKPHQRSKSNDSFTQAIRQPPDTPPRVFRVSKDTRHQTAQHERAMSNNSFTRSFGTSYDTPPQVFNLPKDPPPPLNPPQTPHPTSPPLQTNYGVSAPSKVFNVPKGSPADSPQRMTNPTSPPPQRSDHSHTASTHSRQSLPPLKTNVPSSSLPPSRPRGARGGVTSDPEARKLRRSQIESGGTPRAEQLPMNTTTTTVTTTGGGNVAKNGATGRNQTGSEDELIVMSATSFPGQEWQPNYGWEGD